jgi:Lon protease-like protein
VPARLPLFPLPLVLFPGTHRPLHIHEPRYRTMLADCMAADRAFGVLFRPEGVRERELPTGYVGCVARVERAESLPDGRANIMVEGAHRFVLESFVETDRPYNVGTTEIYEDTDEPDIALAPVAERVRTLFVRVGTAARTLADDSDALPALPDDPKLLAFAIAGVIDMDVAAQQRLLTSRSPGARLRDIELMLAPAVEALEHRAVVHVRAKSNGHGPHGPTVQSAG